MRRGELLSLRWSDVDLPGRRIYLRDTKNGELRVLVLNDLAFDVLASLPVGSQGDLIFPGVDPLKLSVYTRRVFRKIGVSNGSFHSLRHTTGSWLAMSGVDLYAIGEILGHKTPRMTKRYSHLSPDYVSKAVGKLDSVFAGILPSAEKSPRVIRLALPDIGSLRANIA
jgi:integrase